MFCAAIRQLPGECRRAVVLVAVVLVDDRCDQLCALRRERAQPRRQPLQLVRDDGAPYFMLSRNLADFRKELFIDVVSAAFNARTSACSSCAFSAKRRCISASF